MFTYTVDQGKVINIFVEGQDAPAILQSTYPNGDEFLSIEEAENWAQQFIESQTVESAPFPPSGRGQDPHPKPTPEQIAEWQANIAGPAE